MPTPFIVLCLAVFLAVPHPRPSQEPPTELQLKLDARIPAADAARFSSIRARMDAKDWLNPVLLIHADGVWLVSAAVASGGELVPADELRRALVGLPVEAWPYGRVIGASDASIRAAEGKDDEAIDRNHRAVEGLLKDLGVRVVWWPA